MSPLFGPWREKEEPITGINSTGTDWQNLKLSFNYSSRYHMYTFLEKTPRLSKVCDYCVKSVRLLSMNKVVVEEVVVCD